MSIASSLTAAQCRAKCFSGSYGEAIREVLRASMLKDLRAVKTILSVWDMSPELCLEALARRCSASKSREQCRSLTC